MDEHTEGQAPETQPEPEVKPEGIPEAAPPAEFIMSAEFTPPIAMTPTVAFIPPAEPAVPEAAPAAAENPPAETAQPAETVPSAETGKPEESVPPAAEEGSATEEPAAEITAAPAEPAAVTENPRTAEIPAEKPAEAVQTPAESTPSAEEPAPAPDASAAPEQPSAEAAPPAEEPQAEPPKPESEKQKEEYTAKNFLEDAIDLLGHALIAMFCGILLYAYVFCVADVEGSSMLPTLTDGDRVLVSRITGSLETGDILILDSRLSFTFDRNDNLIQGAGLGKRIVKRLIAQGGQEINIDFAEGVVYVDGEVLDEKAYIKNLTKRDEGGFSYPFTVPEGYLFVMGDNRNISKDSRHPDVGLIPEDAVVGSVLLRLTPFSEFGRVG